MPKMMIIAQKEYLDSIQSKLFLALLMFLLILTVTSIVVASFDFQNKLAE
jgi:ABC-type Na+ efflux pump permease subunit